MCSFLGSSGTVFWDTCGPTRTTSGDFPGLISPKDGSLRLGIGRGGVSFLLSVGMRVELEEPQIHTFHGDPEVHGSYASINPVD